MTHVIVQLVYLDSGNPPSAFALCDVATAAFEKTWPSLISLGAGQGSGAVQQIKPAPPQPWENFTPADRAILREKARLAKAVVWTVPDRFTGVDAQSISEYAQPADAKCQSPNSFWVVDPTGGQVLAMGPSIEAAKEQFRSFIARFELNV